MKNNRLREYFPMLKTRNEVMDIIKGNRRLKSIFYSWSENAREEFLDFCTGQRGIKVLYDSFFKEVFNPEYAPERLNALLSVILGMEVRIIQVLPLDSTRMGDETSLVTMDIVVELQDKSIVNIEIQKIGYYFPGERSACYSSDLILRQYKRVRDNAKGFNYGMIKPVYTIVFFEQSPAVFKEYPNDYIHFFRQQSDTGLSIELLQKYIFIPLDIFRRVEQNKDNELNAWLTFLSSDAPEDILYLIENRPEFKPLYETLFSLCENIEGVMNMFSRELFEMDRNTAQLMVDDFSKKITQLEKDVAEKDNTIAEKDNTIAEKDNTIAEKDNTIAEKDNTIAMLQARIKEMENKK